MLGPLRETPASTAQPMPRASSKHQGRSLCCLDWAWLSVGLHGERLRAWGLVSCSLSLPVGTTAQRAQARPRYPGRPRRRDVGGGRAGSPSAQEGLAASGGTSRPWARAVLRTGQQSTAVGRMPTPDSGQMPLTGLPAGFLAALYGTNKVHCSQNCILSMCLLTMALGWAGPGGRPGGGLAITSLPPDSCR